MNKIKKTILVIVVILLGVEAFKLVGKIYTYKSVTYQGNATMNTGKGNGDVILVNKEHSIGRDYIPENLTVPNVEFMPTSNREVRRFNYDAGIELEKMFNDAKNDGIDLLAVSAYRDYNYQENLYNKKAASSGTIEADKYVSKPGKSEHQTGLAIDILSRDYVSLDEGFENTSAFKWISENCSKYGFIIRYPKNKENITGYNYEPWHLRYVGKEASEKIYKNNITLEEYIRKIGNY